MDLWKTRQVISISGAKPISGKLVDIWMSFPEIGLCHAPQFYKCHFSTKCFILDGFSRKRLVACRMPQNSKIEHWMSFPEISLAHDGNRQ